MLSAVRDQVDRDHGVGERSAVEIAAVGACRERADESLPARVACGLEPPRPGVRIGSVAVQHEGAERHHAVEWLGVQRIGLVELGVQLVHALARLDVDERPVIPREARVAHAREKFWVQAVRHDVFERATHCLPHVPVVMGLDEGLVAQGGLRQCPMTACRTKPAQARVAADPDQVDEGRGIEDALRCRKKARSRVVVLARPRCTLRHLDRHARSPLGRLRRKLPPAWPGPLRFCSASRHRKSRPQRSAHTSSIGIARWRMFCAAR